MEHDGHRQRLRARYQHQGLAGFAPHEVLELLLTFAIPRMDTNGLAHRLIDHFGSLHGVLEANQEELEQVPGIGGQASTLITMVLPLMRMYQQEKLLPKRRISTYADLAAYCRTLFLGVGVEQFYLLCFDARIQLLATRLMADGTPAQVGVTPRQIMQELLRCNAVGAVISHNHPSGSPEPTNEDIEVTREIEALLKSVGIRLYDHVLVAGDKTYSFCANGWLDAPREALPFPQETVAADKPQRVLPARPRGK